MNTPTYQQQWQKLTTAYMNNEIEPNIDCACFVGNLLNRSNEWSKGRYLGEGFSRCNVNPKLRTSELGNMVQVLKVQSNNLYTPMDIIELEKCFLKTYFDNGGTPDDYVDEAWHIHSLKEDALFIAFEKTLDLLKSIHEKKGEVIDTPPQFQKRILQTV